MFKRPAVIISILVLLISLIAYPVVIRKASTAPSANAFGRGLSTGEEYVWLDSGNGGIRLFNFGQQGVVKSIFVDPKVTAVDLCIYDGKLYLLLNETVRRDQDGLIRSYRIRSFTTDLSPIDYTVPFELHAGEKAVDLSIVSGRVVVTSIATDATHAVVYSISLEEIEQLYKDAHDEEKNKGEEITETIVSADSVFIESADSGRLISDAAFSGGELHIRTDADDAYGVFTPDESLYEALSKVSLSFSQKVKLSGNLAVYWWSFTAIVVIIVIILVMIFKGHSKMFYTGLAMELVLVGLIVIFFLGYRQDQVRYVKAAREQYTQNSLRVLASEAEGTAFKSADASWYSSDDYRWMQRCVARFVSREYDSSVIYDAFVVNSLNSTIICSADGINNVKASERYGESDLWIMLANANPTDAYRLSIPGKNYEAVALSMSDSDPYRYVAVFDIGGVGTDVAGLLGMIRNTFILFVAASAVIIFLIWLIASDLKLFDKALSEVAINGKSVYLKPANPVGSDFSDMWNSLREIEKKIEKINYSSYKRYEAYYRFAPKNIEKILGRDSILDVASGDRVTVNGTLSIITNAQESSIDERVIQLNGLLDFFKRNPEKEGVLVSDREGLSSMDVLFTDDISTTTEFAVDFTRDCRETRAGIANPSLFMYHGSFLYGVTGNEDQSKAFLLSEGSEDLLKLATWFNRLRLGVVVTEDIREREIGSFDYRYIGFVYIKDAGRKIKLFEVLDGCPKKERELKLLSRGKFEDAIKLFYQSDYYMARNMFSELLKSNATDEIVRWYLFESERLLDSPPENEESAGALHAD